MSNPRIEELPDDPPQTVTGKVEDASSSDDSDAEGETGGCLSFPFTCWNDFPLQRLCLLGKAENGEEGLVEDVDRNQDARDLSAGHCSSTLIRAHSLERAPNIPFQIAR